MTNEYDMKYDWISNFKDGFAIVKRDGYYGFIDKYGTPSKIIYDGAFHFVDTYAEVQKDGKQLFLNKNFEEFELIGRDFIKKESKMNIVDYTGISDLHTKEKLSLLFDNYKKFIIEKNNRYGDSVLNPMQIFSDQPAEDQILNRIDDKLSRIKNSTELKKNDISDLFGYLALLMVKCDWLDFNEFLD